MAPYPRPTKPLSESSAEPKITALICTLNEAANLPDLLPRIPDWVDEVLLVDGHSADATVEIARRLRPDIRVLFQPGKGKGDALRYGIKQASGDIVVTLDADGTTDPEDLHLFVEPLLLGYEFVKGSRFSRGLPANKPKHRMFGNFLIAMTFNVLYFRMYTDLCSGYNSFWKKSLEGVSLSGGYFEDEPLINARIAKAGLKTKEVGHLDKGRTGGESKAPAWRQGFGAIKTIVKERFRR